MARRRKNTEVLMTGDVVDPRARAKTTTDAAPRDTAPKKKQLEPDGVGGFREVEVTEEVSDSARRLRKRPEVIDVTGAETERPAAPITTGDTPGTAPSGKASSSQDVETDWRPDASGKGANPDNVDWKADSQRGGRGAAEMVADAPRQKKTEDVDWEADPKGGGRTAVEIVPDAPRKKSPDPEWDGVTPPKKSAADRVEESMLVDRDAPLPPPPQPSAPSEPEIKKRAKPRTPKEQSKAVAAAVTGSFVDKVKSEAKKKGGVLSLADIDALEGEFNKQAEAAATVLQESFEEYIGYREQAEWNKSRRLPFNRVMVKQFSHLFAEPANKGFNTVSRRMLPGFFSALTMMMGPDAVEASQERCHLIVERIREAAGGDDYHWDGIYNSKETAAIVMDAQIAIANHFSEYDRRSNWFIELVNANLAPVTDRNSDDAGWELSPAGFKRFLGALLGSLREAMDTDMGKLQVTKRHGADTTDAVMRILNTISK